MNAALTHRSQTSTKHKTVVRTKNPRRSAKPPVVDKREARLLSFTIDADTARVISFESLDAGGGRHELSEDEKASLVRDRGAGQLEDVLERVFEAGIGCALSDEADESKSDDAEDDAELRHLLLARLIHDSPARSLMRREALNRAILGALIRDSLQAPPMAAMSRTTARAQVGRAATARRNSQRGRNS